MANIVLQTLPPKSNELPQTFYSEISRTQTSTVPQTLLPGYSIRKEPTDRKQRCRTLKQKCPGNVFKPPVYNSLNSVLAYPLPHRVRDFSIENFKITEDKSSQNYWKKNSFNIICSSTTVKIKSQFSPPRSEHLSQHTQLLNHPRKSQKSLTWM